MELADYQAKAMRTAKELPHDKALLHSICLLADEVGEYASALKKPSIYGQPWDMDNVIEELGDILYGVAYAAHIFGVSLETVARLNNEKLAMRFPEGYSDFHAAARLDKEVA